MDSNYHFVSIEESGDFNKMLFGLILGGGLKYEILKLQFGLRADYYLDFMKIAEWAAENNKMKGEISGKTFTINLMVGYKLK
jgi:hypothetical protein